MLLLRDLTSLTSSNTHNNPLVQIGSTTGHTRPVECLAVDHSTGYRMYSADSLGVIKAWEVESHPTPTTSRRLTHVGDLEAHTMGVTDMWVAHGRVWSGELVVLVDVSPAILTNDTILRGNLASTDNTVRVQSFDKGAVSPCLGHPTHVRSLLPLHLTPTGLPVVIAGSSSGGIHMWDLEWNGDSDDPSVIDGSGARESGLVDVHSHDVSALALWIRHPTIEASIYTSGKGQELPLVKSVEAWIVSGSLDGTLRRWRVTGQSQLEGPLTNQTHPIKDLLDGKHNTTGDLTGTQPQAEANAASKPPEKPSTRQSTFTMTEDEERELAELMSDDDS